MGGILPSLSDGTWVDCHESESYLSSTSYLKLGL